MNFRAKTRLTVLTVVCAALAALLSGCPMAGLFSTGSPTESAAGTITGYARYSGEADSSGINVTAERVDGIRTTTVARMLSGDRSQAARAIAAQATTDASGAFRLTGLAAGTYSVNASSRDSAERTVTTSVTLLSGVDSAVLALLLTPTGWIKGKVTLGPVPAETGNLGIVVFIAGTSYAAMTDDSGAFTMTDVPANTGYVLVASKDGYASKTTSVTVRGLKIITVPDQTLDPASTSAGTGSIAGTVRLNDGPTGNTGIMVFLPGTSYISTTDDGGAFSLTGVAAGTYPVLVASKEGYTPVTASLTQAVSAGGTVDAGMLPSLVPVQMPVISPPEFSPPGGSYFDPQTVTIATAPPGASVRYTTDGSTPTSTYGTVYSGPIGVAVGQTIRAIAYEPGWTDSAISSATYVFPGTALWARMGATGSSSQFVSTAADQSGNVYAVGSMAAVGTFGDGITVYGANYYGNVVLVKYDTSGTALWARTISSTANPPGTGESAFNSTAVDESGNVYAAGFVYGYLTTGTQAFTLGDGVSAAAAYGRQGVLVKYDSSGMALWARTVSSGESETALQSVFTSAAADAYGNVYAAGYGRGTLDFGSGVAATTAGSVFLVKYDSSGAALWARTVTDSTDAYSLLFTSAAVDSDGNVYAAGYTSGPGSFDFGSGVTARPGTGDTVLLAKYDSAGSALWARTVSSVGIPSAFLSTAVDTSGNVLAAGYISGTGTYDFGSGVTVMGPGDSSLVLVKYDSTGTALWARTDGATRSQFESVAADASGSVYAAGTFFGGTHSFGGGVTATSASSASAVLVRYDSSGTALWARTVSNATLNPSEFHSTAVDANGSVYAAGQVYYPGTYALLMPAFWFQDSEGIAELE